MTETITMTFAALSVLWSTPTDAPMVTGIATYSNRMAEVAYNRGHITDPLLYFEWLEAQGLAGAVALNRKADIGRKVWIRGPLGLEGPFLVIDCSQLVHLKRRLELNRVVDVDYHTAGRWGMLEPIPVDVYFEQPDDWDQPPAAGGAEPIPIPL